MRDTKTSEKQLPNDQTNAGSSRTARSFHAWLLGTERATGEQKVKSYITYISKTLLAFMCLNHQPKRMTQCLRQSLQSSRLDPSLPSLPARKM